MDLSLISDRIAVLLHKGRTTRRRRQLLVDISILSRRDAGTGIQRVVRALSEQLEATDLANYDLHFVAATRRQRYRHLERDGATGSWHRGGRISVGSGDIFLGLDLSSRILPRHHRQIAAWRRRGVHIALVVYDLLPIQSPQWFDETQANIFSRWLHFLSKHADQALCISRTVSADLLAWLEREHGERAGTIAICTFPLGGDISRSRPSQGITAAEATALDSLNGRRFVLVVGTIEPRKGHGIALNAFDKLFAEDRLQIPALVIVGRPGWKTESLQDRMREHPRQGTDFFWFADASDEVLDTLYQRCAGVFFPTFAEGFGLPVAEALAHQRPVLVRDLPVFRELQSSLISYFYDDSPDVLARNLVDWLGNFAKERESCQHMALTWQKSCDILLKHLVVSRSVKP